MPQEGAVQELPQVQGAQARALVVSPQLHGALVELPWVQGAPVLVEPLQGVEWDRVGVSGLAAVVDGFGSGDLDKDVNQAFL